MSSADPYKDIAELYLSLVSQEAYQSRDLDDPIISKWISENVPDGAKVLDAGCGLGFETIVLHRGSLGQHTNKRFQAFGTDFSQSMLDAAILNGIKAGIDRNRFRKATFAQLTESQDEWQDFDVAIVNYGIYTFPDDVTIEQYDSYFLDCCRGFATILKTGGHLIFNLRDWAAFVSGENRGQSYENRHDEILYRCEFSWTFSKSGHHKAVLNMSSSEGKKGVSTINYAERTPEQCIEIAARCGFTPVFQGRHGDDAPFNVIVLKKI